MGEGLPLVVTPPNAPATRRVRREQKRFGFALSDVSRPCVDEMFCFVQRDKWAENFCWVVLGLGTLFTVEDAEFCLRVPLRSQRHGSEKELFTFLQSCIWQPGEPRIRAQHDLGTFLYIIPDAKLAQ